MKNTAVIGAGPAGMMAALRAAELGSRVTIYEHRARPGLKLLAAGNGKCNLTNVLPQEDMARGFGREWRFMLPAFAALPPESLRRFFASGGVETVVTDGFHVFPKSQKSMDLLQVLLHGLTSHGVEIHYGTHIDSLMIHDGQIAGLASGGRKFDADRVIVAAGGRSSPQLGSDGSGFTLAEMAGHRIVPPVPGLVGLRTMEKFPGTLAGLVLPHAVVSIDLKKEKTAPQYGELLFTHHGISGPAVLDLAGAVNRLLGDLNAVPLVIKLCRDYPEEFWVDRLAKLRQRDGAKLVRSFLREFFAQSLTDVLLHLAQIELSCKVAELKKTQIEELIRNLAGMTLTVVGNDGFDKSMVTDGGVELARINPKTLESRLVKGLFFAGEVLNLAGRCGGYNLSWAFASGYLAGSSGLDNDCS